MTHANDNMDPAYFPGTLTRAIYDAYWDQELTYREAIESLTCFLHYSWEAADNFIHPMPYKY